MSKIKNIFFLLLVSGGISAIHATSIELGEEDVKRILRSSSKFVGKVTELDFKENRVCRKIETSFLSDEDIKKILNNSNNILPSTRRVEKLDFENDIIFFKK